MMVENFGVDTARLKIIIFVYAALLAALSGWLYAHFLRFVSPHPFNLNGRHRLSVHGGDRRTPRSSGSGGRRRFGRARKELVEGLVAKVTSNSANFEIMVFGCLFILLLHKRGDGLVPTWRGNIPADTPGMVPAGRRRWREALSRNCGAIAAEGKGLEQALRRP